ncbi:MAG: LPS export ABC transporter permease LptG [Hyphomicrobiales bacterium]|nr:MAG: LPS export ABC transporter permease LptG [Hyphomicrobiales bacterium]
MMWTLAIYFARRFLFAIVGIFFGGFALIFVVDFVELLRRAGDVEGFSMLDVAIMSFTRVPSLTERILPFAAFFGAMATFFSLSRKLELVVARASGISVWQFIAPGLLVATFIGAFGFAIYNPLSATMKEISLRYEAKIFGEVINRYDQHSKDNWIRQGGEDGDSILRARSTYNQGAGLSGVTIIMFDRNGRFSERIDAKRAELQDKSWLLIDAIVITPQSAAKHFDQYILSTHLTAEEVRESIAAPESIPFWGLFQVIKRSEAAGLPAHRYRLRFQTLLSRPLLLAAMVLIAATVSLRISRLGNVGRLILTGVAAGFMLYVITELAEDLGGAGLVPAILAAWVPAITAALLGFTVLLYQEDG